ncbi:MAG TPA: ester cyclase [Anaerolineales bacterium]|nr:ester cyclase [Anaerolineales bacterium]
MSTQYKIAARNFIEKGLNQKDLSVLDEYFSPKLIDHALPPGLPPGLEGRKIFASALLSAFPDLHVQLEDMVADGDKLVTRYTVHGTHNGELMGISPTGKQISIGGIAIDRFENGQSVEHWEIIDQMGLMQQLGVIPS